MRGIPCVEAIEAKQLMSAIPIIPTGTPIPAVVGVLSQPAGTMMSTLPLTVTVQAWTSVGLNYNPAPGPYVPVNEPILYGPMPK